MRFLFFIIKMILVAVVAVNSSGCASLKSSCPYEIDGELGHESGCSVNCYNYTFTNRGFQSVNAFDLVVSFFDQDGEPVFSSDWITVPVKKKVEPGQTVSLQLDLEQFLEDEYEWINLDYCYAMRIVYEDGTIWEDVFGRYGIH